MAKNKELKGRIQVIQVTQKITKALQMVAASKLEKTRKKAAPLQHYLNRLITTSSRHLHPSPPRNPSHRKELMVVSTSDKGLCGAFNQATLQRAYQVYKEQQAQGHTLEFIPVGKKSLAFFSKKQLPCTEDYTYLHRDLQLPDVEKLVDVLLRHVATDHYTHLTIAYQTHSTPTKENVTIETLYPTPPPPPAEKKERFLYEATPTEIGSYLERQLLTIRLYRALLTSQLTEHKVRMVMMYQASDNAEKMLEKLRLLANKNRQALITQETAEIAAGAQANA